VRSYRGDTLLSKIRWAPAGRKFAYTSDKLGKSLWVVDLDKETSTPTFTDTGGISDYVWSPDGSFIIYTSNEGGPVDTHGVHRLLDVDDRQPGWRTRSYLNRLNVEQGTRYQLTSGELSTFLNDISPDSRRILFSRYRPDYTQRPFSEVTYHVMDLTTLEVTDLWTSRWAGGAVWAPDGKRFLITASPSQFDSAGLDPDAGPIPSEYDTQAFIYDPETRQVDPISLNFDPKIDSFAWSNVDQQMYFLTTDKDYGNMYRYDPTSRIYTKLDTGVEVIGLWDIAYKAPIVVYAGSGVTNATKIYTLNTKTGKRTLMADPGAKEFRDVRFGKVEPQNFTNIDGTEIEGMLYYPPNFDSTKKYPCIVYYYSGTTPIQRMFFEKSNLYAANGYMVYVLQPSGAVGYGQKFSSLHVNDWGVKVADEIILGVKTLLTEHPYIDPDGVGCTGASYGGFMTMLLTTRTDLFAAAISHAGISDIASHWGQGYYGLGYCSVAAADSYPWNRRDLFVDQSPIFNADKIHTPLLLTHGTVDTNVPPGQSMQIYAALRLLGREVEFLQFAGENHGIENYDRRVAWKKAALAWFDKHLKKQPQWWEKQYGHK
jgi:dipeptidyl aminopeptidase/acylaminoacyl peptidase